MDKKEKLIAIKNIHNKGEIIAKAKGDLAKDLYEIAKDNQVPIIEDETLLSILDQNDLYDDIPNHLFCIISELLQYVVTIEKDEKI